MVAITTLIAPALIPLLAVPVSLIGAFAFVLLFSAASPLYLESAAVHASVDNQASDKSLDLFAEELRLAQNALNEITGEFTSDDLLGVIFSSFCIGK